MPAYDVGNARASRAPAKGRRGRAAPQARVETFGGVPPKRIPGRHFQCIDFVPNAKCVYREECHRLHVPEALLCRGTFKDCYRGSEENAGNVVS